MFNHLFLISDHKSIQPQHNVPNTPPSSSSFGTALNASTKSSHHIELASIAAPSMVTSPRPLHETLPLAAFHPLAAAAWIQPTPSSSTKTFSDCGVTNARPFSALYDIICKEKQLASMSTSNQPPPPPQQQRLVSSPLRFATASAAAAINHQSPSLQQSSGVHSTASPLTNGHSRLQSTITSNGSTASRYASGGRSSQDFSAAAKKQLSPICGDSDDAVVRASPGGKR